MTKALYKIEGDNFETLKAKSLAYVELRNQQRKAVKDARDELFILARSFAPEGVVIPEDAALNINREFEALGFYVVEKHEFDGPGAFLKEFFESLKSDNDKSDAPNSGVDVAQAMLKTAESEKNG